MKPSIPTAIIEQKIFLVRGHKVMLSPHLAELYQVETRALIQAVKRNVERFPEDFMFNLDRQEIMRMSQFVTSLKFSKSVYAFTEQGVAMLSGVLHSQRAVAVNIAIMRTFVNIREVIISHKELTAQFKELERKVGKHDQEILIIFEAIRKLMPPPPEKPKRPISILTKKQKTSIPYGRGLLMIR